MDTKRGRGRPPKSGTSKSARIELRVDEEERDAWTQAAEAVGQERSDWIRQVLNKAAKRALK